MTYITRDDSKIDDSSFVHFLLGDVHYVACYDLSHLEGIQRIPWELFYSKMKQTQAHWIVPSTASAARVNFNNQKEQFLEELRLSEDEGKKKTEQLIISKKSRDKSLLDVERERVRKEAYRWR